MPWTRHLTEAKVTRDGRTVDLPRYVRENRERLVLKPNDEYGGKGVFLGAEMTDADWEAALAESLRSAYVVQEKVELARQSSPSSRGRPSAIEIS